MTSERADDVPVFVEAVIRAGQFPFVRCSYLSIERDDPDPSWTLSDGDAVMPFMLVHLAGVITHSLEGTRFTAPTLIEDLFTALEDNQLMSIEASDLWLPRSLFESAPQTGFVFRVARRLFTNAFRYRNGSLDEESFLAQVREVARGIEFSEEETGAFSAWHESQLDTARERFPKNVELTLRRREGLR